MNTLYTLFSLCNSYDKIEIPIIQRDYAQGREEQESLRNNFVNYLIKALSDKKPIELDFIYGNIRTDQDTKNPNRPINTFIPIDGQQRLTTLWLLHWFLSVKEGCLGEISSWMKKFSYETRPSSHDFCHRLMTEQFPEEQLNNIDGFIRDQSWFDNEWKHDGTVSGMLRMLNAFSHQKALLNGSITLDQLLLNNAISFYFVHLEQFGLSEELYIRMNARGKVLTDFENFKSEFYKILKTNPRLEEVKNKMECVWVENLWPYRKKNVFVTDNCFMNYLGIITRMAYFRKAEYRADYYPNNFLEFPLLREIYSDSTNVDFLMFSLDIIPTIKSIKTNDLLWESNGTTLSDILATAIQNGFKSLSIDKMIILFSCLTYLKRHHNEKKLVDFIRVVRNLIYNTKDKSEREQPHIMRSIEKLSEDIDVYNAFSKSNYNLEGLRDSQCDEEHFKALVLSKYQHAKDLLFKIEDNSNFKGNIFSLLAGTYASLAEEIDSFNLSDDKLDTLNLQRLSKLFDCYKIVSKSDFNQVWGDLINTSLYHHIIYSGRLVYAEEYSKHPSMIALTVSYMNSQISDLETYLISREKKNVRALLTAHPDLETIRNVKQQVYLLYVLTRRILGKGVGDFFKNGYRFGWLVREEGFSSLFDEGIDSDPGFSNKGNNPIFQTYNAQFRYNWGLYHSHALPPEEDANKEGRDFFDELKAWSEK